MTPPAPQAATGLDLDAIRDMGLIGTRHPVPARTVLFRAGERADVMYVLLEGSIFVLDTDASGQEIVIDQVGPKTLVGEMALLTGEPRMATVRAAVDSVFLRVMREELDRAPFTVCDLEGPICVEGDDLETILRRASSQPLPCKRGPRNHADEWHVRCYLPPRLGNSPMCDGMVGGPGKVTREMPNGTVQFFANGADAAMQAYLDVSRLQAPSQGASDNLWIRGSAPSKRG